MSQNLSDETKEKIADSLDAATFNLGDFLNDKWDFPSFSETVYLDGNTAAQIAELDQKLHEVNGRLEKLDREANRTSSLGGSNHSAVREAEAEKSKLEAQKAELATKFKESSLTIVFKLQKPANVLYKEASEQAAEQFPHMKAKEREESEEAINYQAKLLFIGAVDGIYNHEGKKHEGELTVNQVQKLYDSVVASERQKLERGMNFAITGGDVMKSAADAGFPS